MAEKITFYPVTKTTRAALRFCDSPLIRMGEAVAEARSEKPLPIEEQMIIVLDRCKEELSQKWDELFESVWVLAAPEEKLKPFLYATREHFRATAKAEIKDRVPPDVLKVLIDAAFTWWGKHLRFDDLGKGAE